MRPATRCAVAQQRRGADAADGGEVGARHEVIRARRACARTGCRWLAWIEVPRRERVVEQRDRLLEQRARRRGSRRRGPVRRAAEAEHARVGVPGRAARPPRSSRSIASSERGPDLLRRAGRRTTSRTRAPAMWRRCRARGSPPCGSAICPPAPPRAPGRRRPRPLGVDYADPARARRRVLRRAATRSRSAASGPAAVRPPSRSPKPNSGCEPNSTTRPSPHAPATMFATPASTASSSSDALRTLAEHLLPGGEALGAAGHARERLGALEQRAVVVRDLERLRASRP